MFVCDFCWFICVLFVVCLLGLVIDLFEVGVGLFAGV